MPKSLPVELRERILQAVLEGNSTHQQIADRFYVSIKSVGRIIKLYNEKGSVLPLPPNNGDRWKIDGKGLQFIQACLQETPDLILREIKKLYADKFGIDLYISVIDRTLKHHKITRKKKIL